jgi:hypothetical protein
MSGEVKLTGDSTKVTLTVFHYKDNEYFMKYTGAISTLPSGAVASAHSKCFLCLRYLKLRREVE